MIARSRNVLGPALAAVALATVTLAAQETGIKNKRPAAKYYRERGHMK